MKLKITLLAITTSFALALSLPVLLPNTHSTYANSILDMITGTNTQVGDEHGADQGVTVGGVLRAVLSTTFFLAGILAVAFLIRAGLQYVTASGDASKISTAKNTILYAVIGLIVSLSAFAITQFVFDRITDSSASAPADDDDDDTD